MTYRSEVGLWVCIVLAMVYWLTTSIINTVGENKRMEIRLIAQEVKAVLLREIER